MTTTESHPALNHRCPFCRADAGQACRPLRGHGRELDGPHSRRLAIVHDWRKQQRELEQALCCECGNLRSFKRARNQLAEWDDKQNWHRMTGDLKCDMCSRITRHAILRAGIYRDSPEEFLRVAQGEKPTDRTDAARLRAEYRQGLPRNPYLHHRYWVAEQPIGPPRRRTTSVQLLARQGPQATKQLAEGSTHLAKSSEN